MKIVIIDNYDSFTYNLSHLVKELGAEVTVMRNDSFKLEELKVFDKIILSPGPGIPSEAGLLPDVIRTYTGKKPILGVCLGEQAIGEVFGAKLHCKRFPDKAWHGTDIFSGRGGDVPADSGHIRSLEGLRVRHDRLSGGNFQYRPEPV